MTDPHLILGVLSDSYPELDELRRTYGVLADALGGRADHFRVFKRVVKNYIENALAEVALKVQRQNIDEK